eukprot:COSAG04_NODE_22_length_37957_cov_250.276930_21_plen_197_part_00
MEALTPFKAKEMAGNIIAAIASTNAIVAAYIVLEGIKVLSKRASECNGIFLTRLPMGRRQNAYLWSQSARAPNESCFVCGRAMVTVTLDTKKSTLDFLVSKVLKAGLGFGQANVSFGANELVCASHEEYDEDYGEGAMARNLAKVRSLNALPVRRTASLTTLRCLAPIDVGRVEDCLGLSARRGRRYDLSEAAGEP